jgi:hypothetical protein
MNKSLLISASVLALCALAAFQWRDHILGRISDVHTASVDQGLMGLGPSGLQNSGQVNRTTARPSLIAQTNTSNPPVTVPASSPAPRQAASAQAPVSAPADPPPAVDESALRYFASKGDTARLQAEIARLRSLYPNWTPPADPLAVPQTGDPQLENMWQLYASSRYAEVRKAIADRQASEAGWQPPDNLLEGLALAEARQRLVNSSDLKQYTAVIDTAAGNPGLLTCGEVDVLWRLAEAFAKTEKPERARDAYLYILNNCEGAGERLGTVQKASTLLPVPMVEDLLAREKPGPDGQPEFEPIKDDLARQFVANAGEKPDIIVSDLYLQRLERLAESQKLASDALLLGWYNIRRQKMDDAEKWFRRAHDEEDSASASQGLALALIARGEPREAEDVMFKWRTSSDDARATYLAAAANLLALDPPIALEPDVLKRIAGETVAQKDAATAQEFGWYSRAFQQPQLALQWFSAALSWKADDEPSAYGLALTYQETNNVAEVLRLQQQWGATSQRIADVGRPLAVAGQRAPVVSDATVANTEARAAQGTAAYQTYSAQTVAPRQARAVTSDRSTRAPRASGCSTVTNPQRLSAQAALQQGWCLMEANRPAEALKAFEAALDGNQSTVRSDAAYGQSLAYLRMGLTDNAAVSATKSNIDKSKATELQIAILTNRALAAFQNDRYAETLLLLDQRARFATERTDLMVIRGYAYLNMRRYADAIQIFEGVASTGNREAIKGLAAAREARPARGPQGGG